MFWIVITASGVLGLAISFTSMWFLHQTSATTYSLVGSLNKIPLSIAGILLFKVRTSMENSFSILFGLLAGVFFARAKLLNNSQSQSQAKLYRLYKAELFQSVRFRTGCSLGLCSWEICADVKILLQLTRREIGNTFVTMGPWGCFSSFSSKSVWTPCCRSRGCGIRPHFHLRSKGR